MKSARLVFLGVCVAAVLGPLAGCGSSSTPSGESTATPAASQHRETGGSPSAEAAPSEAESAATGDIPDNQTFLVYRDPAGGYAIRYPEGWARKGSGPDVTFQEKANVIHLTVARGSSPTAASVLAQLSRLKRTDPTVKAGKPEQVTLSGSPVVKVTYTRESAPDPVTGKRLPLSIDRYVYASGGKVAVLDLATPVGVDNVDAYRMISESFRWNG
jgi:hypothetical protein